MVEVNGLEMFNSDNLDEKTINSVSLEKPVILAEISSYQFNVIDGNHRIKKASRSNVTKVPAYKVYSGQHIKFLTSDKAYKHISNTGILRSKAYKRKFRIRA